MDEDDEDLGVGDMWGTDSRSQSLFPSNDADNDSTDEEEDVPREDVEVIRQACTDAFSSKDFIMEPGISYILKRFLQAGGSPERVVELLSDNYSAMAQTVNLLAEWLIHTGADIKEVQDMVERHLTDMILKHFDTKKADQIFSDEGETPSWLAEMIDHPPWRKLFYKLAEEYPDCLMLNFTIKLISDAGYQGEITSVSTACHQIEVFSRVLRTSITSFLQGGDDVLEKNLPEFTKMVSHGHHTYLYSQVLMYILSQETKGGSNVKRLCQELHRCATQRGLDVTPVTLALNGASAYPRACQALSSMLSRNALNPADITVLYKMYSDQNPPTVELIRMPAFLDLLIASLFRPSSKINPEHKSKYIYILAYAASIVEASKKGTYKAPKDELKVTMQSLEKAHTLCSENKSSSELTADVTSLFQCIKFPVVALGMLYWVDHTVSDPSYFKLNTDHTPIHLVLVDEIATSHPLLHQRALNLLVRLFQSPLEALDVLVRLELKKTVLDRMVHLFSRGCVIPVVSFIRDCVHKRDTDMSLVRYFVTEVLDVVAPPYTSDFIQLFLPVLENDEITGSLRLEEGNDPVSDFITHCRTNYILN